MSVLSNGASLRFRNALSLVLPINLCTWWLEGILQIFQNGNWVSVSIQNRIKGTVGLDHGVPLQIRPPLLLQSAIKAQQLNLCLVLMLTRLYLLGNRLSSQLLSGCSWLMKGHRMAGARSIPAALSLTTEQGKLCYCEKGHRSRMTGQYTTPWWHKTALWVAEENPRSFILTGLVLFYNSCWIILTIYLLWWSCSLGSDVSLNLNYFRSLTLYSYYCELRTDEHEPTEILKGRFWAYMIGHSSATDSRCLPQLIHLGKPQNG